MTRFFYNFENKNKKNYFFKNFFLLKESVKKIIFFSVFIFKKTWCCFT